MGETLPLPDIFAKPQRDQLRISPSGSYIGWRARNEGVLNIWVRTTGYTATRCNYTRFASAAADI
jgi:hypothetical protein